MQSLSMPGSAPRRDKRVSSISPVQTCYPDWNSHAQPRKNSKRLFGSARLLGDVIGNGFGLAIDFGRRSGHKRVPADSRQVRWLFDVALLASLVTTGEQHDR